jgi:hypothetical protein
MSGDDRVTEDPVKSIDMGSGFRHPGVATPVLPSGIVSSSTGIIVGGGSGGGVSGGGMSGMSGSQHPRPADLSAVFARNMQSANSQSANSQSAKGSPGTESTETAGAIVRAHSLGARGIKQLAVSPIPGADPT